jgi:dipeptidyl aminopeptidase/acylaminoacyl peptidase
MPRLIGSPVDDAALLAEASPLRRVAEFKLPLLLAHGIHDRRVPQEHAREFGAAARRAGVQIEQRFYDEGHGFYDPANAIDYYEHLERFLARWLGGGN